MTRIVRLILAFPAIVILTGAALWAAPRSAPSGNDAIDEPVGVTININSASADQLQTLPRIGPALSARIVAYREQHGPFRDARDLDRVKGIGPKTIEQLEAYISYAE